MIRKINTYLLFISIITITILSISCTIIQFDAPSLDNVLKEEKMHYLAKEDEDKKLEAPIVVIKSTYIKATADVNIRSKPNLASQVVGVMDKGDMLKYIEDAGDFYKTVYKEKEAYISKRYATIYEFIVKDEKIEKIIDFGATLLGYPYIFGAQRYHWGNGRLNSNFKNGEFDCSSLMQYIFFKEGKINLLNTTREQVRQGEAVDNLKRGDLMFFTNSSRINKTGIERIGHVAMYLGDNYILHTASDHAVIEEISKTRWSYFIEARRFDVK